MRGHRRSTAATPLAALAAAVAAVVALAGCGALGGTWTSGGAGAPVTPTPASADPTRSATPFPSATAPRSPSPSPSPASPPSAAPSSPTPSTSASRPPRTTLVRGDRGPEVLELQRRLTGLGYWLGTPDGSFGSLTQQAVWALQKAAGIRRDGVVGPRTRAALAEGVRPRPTLSGDGVEIDLERQLLLVVRGGSVRTVLNTSTGNREEYTTTSGTRAIAVTPRGSFTVYRAVDGPVTNSLGQLWRPRFFHRGYAVHGSPNIPPWPASHGCARLSNAAMNMIWATDLMPVGSRVLVR
ncbi:hypothetical protein GCM10023168_33260 [Fodinibacter luteus]|uniref:L,D-TPase catalytic domain-containing protein n=1 Tax=Fodinibacter luteus TaxID=552064 RepID=A0ABP8KPC2_9MICO